MMDENTVGTFVALFNVIVLLLIMYLRERYERKEQQRIAKTHWELYEEKRQRLNELELQLQENPMEHLTPKEVIKVNQTEKQARTPLLFTFNIPDVPLIFNREAMEDWLERDFPNETPQKKKTFVDYLFQGRSSIPLEDMLADLFEDFNSGDLH